MSEQIDSAIRWAIEQIQPFSETARLDAELLLAHCLDKSRSYLYAWPKKELSPTCWQQYQDLIRRRQRPTPVAYLVGKREFFSLEFASTPAALVPRPETELAVELALAQIPKDQAMRICDLGTGAGTIAITVKKQRPQVQICATDIDADCIALARSNAQRHHVEIEFIVSDWFQAIPADRDFDLIISNPPYIAADHPFLVAGDLPAEPQLALTPGKSGLEALELIIRQAPGHLRSGGSLILEHGYDQQAPVADLLKQHGFGAIRCESDYNDLPRTSVAKLVEKLNYGA